MLPTLAALTCGYACAGPPARSPISATDQPELAAAVEIIVRFKDDVRVTDIMESFWKDAPSARAKFEVFKKNWPDMAGMVLERVTYAGELVLVCKKDRSGGLARVQAIAARLAAAPGISYAEANALAQVQAQ